MITDWNDKILTSFFFSSLSSTQNFYNQAQQTDKSDFGYKKSLILLKQFMFNLLDIENEISCRESDSNDCLTEPGLSSFIHRFICDYANMSRDSAENNVFAGFHHITVFFQNCVNKSIKNI